MNLTTYIEIAVVIWIAISLWRLYDIPRMRKELSADVDENYQHTPNGKLAIVVIVTSAIMGALWPATLLVSCYFYATSWWESERN
jgi:hypothetical protein